MGEVGRKTLAQEREAREAGAGPGDVAAEGEDDAPAGVPRLANRTREAKQVAGAEEVRERKEER